MKDKVGVRILYLTLYLGLIFLIFSLVAGQRGFTLIATGLSHLWKFLPTVSIKKVLVSIGGFCSTIGLFWLIFPFCASRVFEFLYSEAQDELHEGLRLTILSQFRMSCEAIRQSIKQGGSIYAESINDGVCCLITQGETSKIGVVKRLSDNSVDQFECDDVSEEIIALVGEGINVYDSRVLTELQNRGFELCSV